VRVGGAEVAGVTLQGNGGGSAQPGRFAIANDLEAWAFPGHQSGLALSFDGRHMPLRERGDVAGDEDEVG